MSEIERRQLRERVELRAGDGAESRIGGYAAKFMRLSQNLGGFVEQIDRGFFAKSEGDGWPNVMARYNHEELLATTAAESLRLAVDEVGLDYTADLLDDPFSQRVLALVTRGDVSRSSFAFYVTEDSWSQTEQGFPLRTLHSGVLVDVAPVDQPAYMDTSTALRSLAEQRGADIEAIREAARANELGRFITPSPTVVDLGAPKNDGQRGQGDTHPAGRVHVLRRALDLKK